MLHVELGHREVPRVALRARGERTELSLDTQPFLALLELSFERVLVSHGEPVHTRADFEAALEREPWSQFDGA